MQVGPFDYAVSSVKNVCLGKLFVHTRVQSKHTERIKQLRGRWAAQTQKCVNSVKGTKAGVNHEAVQSADCVPALSGLLVCWADLAKSSENLDFGIELSCGLKTEIGGGRCR